MQLTCSSHRREFANLDCDRSGFVCPAWRWAAESLWGNRPIRGALLLRGGLLRGGLLTLGALLVGVLAAADVLASPDVDPVESTRDVLRQGPGYPWYDAQRDEVRRIDVRNSETPNPDNRDSTWQDRGTTASGGNTARLLGSGFWTFMQGLAWTLLAVLLAGLIALLVWAFVKSEGRLPADGEGGVTVRRASDIDRVESLPFPVRRPDADLLSEARRQYEAGNYREAIIYLFSYQLVQLDKHQLIHLSKGKTNRQYLWEIRRRPDLSRLLETTMIAFEDVFFGHHDLERPRFEHCWHGLDEFHRQMEQAQAVT